MRLFISFITSISLFLISGCSNATIKTLERNQLLISNGETAIKVTTANIETSRKNMSMIYIDQNIIAANEDNCIVYEAIRTSGGYRFNNTYARTIDIIFDAYDVEEGNSYGNLVFYRLTLKDRSTLNLLALTGSKKALKVIYGFDDSVLADLEGHFMHKSRSVDYKLSTTIERRDHCIKSSWQPKILIMDNVVGKIRGGGF